MKAPAAHSSRSVSRRQVLLLASPMLLLGSLVALSVCGYLFVSARLVGPGFPLDDAWIHQTYARSLAQTGQWSYLPGQPSAGSTAPLWSLLLALGYRLGLNPLTWTYFLGALGLFGASLAGEAFSQRLLSSRSTLPWAGLFLAAEWHLGWASVSGMETTLYAALILLVFWLLSTGHTYSWAWLGLLIGLAVWVRPDALTLLGPAGLVLLLTRPGWRARFTSAGFLLFGFLLLFIPYLLFNLHIQGSLWPNTFYAKQAEYALSRQVPFLTRLWEQLKLPLTGAGVLLFPGFAWCLWQSLRRRWWVVLSAGIWFLGFAALYALRLPVTYQYGRYLMPAMPVYFVLGIVGLRLIFNAHSSQRLTWVLKQAWLFSLVAVWLAFYGLVASFYARDVAIVQTEMVAAAHWVADNTPPDALIAAHDIGALGYFGNRRLVDLAGLISPQVIPFMRDETALAHWLDAQGVDYLVTFPGWYAALPIGKMPVYQSENTFSSQAGGKSIWIYRWTIPSPLP